MSFEFYNTSTPTGYTEEMSYRAGVEADITAINGELTTLNGSVTALAEVTGSVDLSGLTTTDKTSLVNAINENVSNIATNTSNISTNTGNIATNTSDITENTNGIATLVTRGNEKEYNVKSLGLYSDDTNETTNSTLLNAFIEAHKTEAITIYFPVGTYRFNQPIILYPKHNFRGAGTIGTKLKYVGTGNAMQLPSGTDSNYEYTYLDTYYEDFTLMGAGSSYGVGATSNGIYLGDETLAKLFNTPMLRFNRIRVMGFTYGIYVEGYGHTFQDVYITNNDRGLIIVHPEQVMCNNTWIEYANVGLYLNPLTKVSRNYGHNMVYIGGAVQRNVIGLKALNFSDLIYNTYCEGNTQTDVILGDPADPTNYTNGVNNAKIDINIDGDYSDNSVKFIASKSCDVKVLNYGGAVSQTLTSPLIYVNGYSKNNIIRLYSEYIKANTSVDLAGDSIKTTTIIMDGSPVYYRSGSTIIDTITNSTSSTVAKRYIEYSNNSVHLVNELGSDNSLGVKLTSGSNSCFNVLDSSNNKLLSVSLVNNAVLKKHLIIPDNKGIVLYSPNGTKYLVTVTDAGVLNVASTTISY